MAFQENFAIVIPAYNEEKTIRDVVQRALKQCKQVIVVDDGSNDNTILELKGLPIDLIEHKMNQGKASSLWDGFQLALKKEVDFIVTLDGDAQHAPEDTGLLIDKRLKYNHHIIIGARLADKDSIPAKRYYANKIANFWIAWAAGYPISDSQSGFRLYPANFLKKLKISTSKNNSFVFESEIIIKAAQVGIISQSVPIPAVYREDARPSHFQGVRDITLITLMVAKFLILRGVYPQGLYKSAIKPMILKLFR
ncbi:MAG: glycosyltransferase family 2 protein [Gammaproteobacteria bacterium]|nr:MAG: glycosyltransferase family 2 protein [Gammaproteobacteria bacterium]